MTGKKTILVADDDKNIRQVLCVLFQEEGFDVIPAADGIECLRLAYERHPDLILLDILMSGKDGREVCKQLREVSNVPIIILSALGDTPEKVERLQDGADDYVAKPYVNAELVARARALLRRSHQHNEPPPRIYDDGFLFIDFEAHLLTAEGESERLTPKEWRVLEYLFKNKNRLVKREDMLRDIWGKNYENENADHYPKVFIFQLRRKLHDPARRPRYIHNERNLGYRFETHN